MTDKFRVSPFQRGPGQSVPLTMAAGDKITDCVGLWDASGVSDDLAKCGACGRRTFRIVIVTSLFKLEKKTALCGKHFIVSASAFPELRCGRWSYDGIASS